MKYVDPIQAFLCGALLATVQEDKFTKVLQIVATEGSPTGFKVAFASGLQLKVDVSVIKWQGCQKCAGSGWIPWTEGTLTKYRITEPRGVRCDCEKGRNP